MRISDWSGLGTLALLASCHGKPSDAAASANAAQATATAADPNAVECAPAGASAFARACTVDRDTTVRGLVLTLRNPDGGFHRLLVTRDGHGVAAADGAQPVAVVISGGASIDVALGHDRYRLPATVRRRS
jgi:hypothetical protein